MTSVVAVSLFLLVFLAYVPLGLPKGKTSAILTRCMLRLIFDIQHP